MSAFLIALSTWLHALATVVFIGHYVFMTLVYLPLLAQRVKGSALRELLEQVSSRLRPIFGGSLLVFLVTGTHLMLINEDYLGLGNFFGNAWSILIVVKHVAVLAFLALAVYSERSLMAQIGEEKPAALHQFRFALGINTALGTLIVLLTSIAQVA